MAEVRVLQKDGPISISVGGDEPTTWHVSDHTTNVAEENLETFLALVPDSRVVSETDTTKKGK